jgi:transposase
VLEAGTSQRQIGRLTGIDRKTIRAVQLGLAVERANSPGVATGSAPQTPPPRPSARPPTSVSNCEPHRAFIEAQLRLKRNFMAIYQDLVDRHGFTGAYNSVKRFAGALRERQPEQLDRLEFAPGEEAQVDYGEGALTRVAGTERYRKPRLFVMTLRYSRRSFRRVVWKSSQETWARLHEDAWRYFGGSTRYVVLDNLKEGVTKPDLYEPELNAVYAATLAHYAVVADPARVRDPTRIEGETSRTAMRVLPRRSPDRCRCRRLKASAPGLVLRASVRDDDPRRTPGTLFGRQDRRRLGLRPVQAHGNEHRAVRGRQPVGLLVLARRVLLEVDRQRAVGA